MERKLLLVDDEEGIRKVLGISLMDAGYDVLTAKSGEEAYELFKDAAPPIVLTDIKMPGMDGIGLLRKIKQDSPETEVIMITGHGDMDLAIESLKHEATDFITKPINDDILEFALRKAEEKIGLRKKVKEYTENLETLVQEKTRQLIEAERLAAVGQTVAGLAHAIKNITGGLKGGAYVLEKGMELKNDKYLQQGWDMIKNNVTRIKDLSLDLLNYAKEREPNFEKCDPNQLLQEVYEWVRPIAEVNRIDLELDLQKSLPNVLLDREAIYRCLLNLAINAVDACIEKSYDEGRGKIIMSTAKPEGWAVELQIIDNGCGMDSETKNKVFQCFFSTKGSKGTGLGLMLTKKAIDEHGGVIDLQSEEKKGTKFIIRLPDKNRALI
jgi:signal transduction histidine kinase